MLYVLYAADQMYAGYHGMVDWSIENCDTEEEALDMARENSLEVINSYSNIYEALEEDVKECINENTTEEEEWEIRSDIYNEDVEYNIWKIDKDIVKDYDIEELEKWLNDDPEDFIEKYCEAV